MRAVPVLLLVGACSFSGSAGGDGQPPIDGQPLPSELGIDAPEVIDAAPAPWLTGYTHRRRIDLLSPSEPLTNFVLLVQLESDADLQLVADPSGQSIRFTLADGVTLTPWEVELYDADEGTLAAWVRVPQMRAGEALYLYYGSSSPPAEPAQPIWDDSIYSLVMHFADPGNGPWQSATADNDSMAVPSGATGPAGVFAPMGVGRRFGGNDRIELDAGGSDRLQFGTSSFSFSVMMKTPTNLGQWDMPFYKGGSNAGQAGFDMELGTGPWRTCISDGDNQGASSILCADFIPESTPILDQWHWLTTVVNREAQKLQAYRDGMLQDEVDITAIGDLDTTTRLMVSNMNYKFNGDVDELRVYRSTLTAAWIATEWANAFDADTVRRIGAPESP